MANLSNKIDNFSHWFMVQQFKWNMFLLYVPKKDMYHYAWFIMDNIAPLRLNSMFELTSNNQFQGMSHSCSNIFLFGRWKGFTFWRFFKLCTKYQVTDRLSKMHRDGKYSYFREKLWTLGQLKLARRFVLFHLYL